MKLEKIFPMVFIIYIISVMIILLYVDTKNIKIHDDIFTVDKIESISRTHSTYYLQWWDTTYRNKVVFQRIEINDLTGKYLPRDTLFFIKKK